MSDVKPAEDADDFDSEVPLLIVGAGAAGLCAALAASEIGVDPVVIERDAVPSGSTALSAGLIPAAGTRFQREKDIADSAKLFAEDIARKSHDEADPKLVQAVASKAGPTVEWLAEAYGMPFEVITDFNYPGHSAHRMHGLPSRTGAELIDRLRGAAEAREIPILTRRACETLFADEDGFIEGVEIMRGARDHRLQRAGAWPAMAMGETAALVRSTFPRWRTRFTSAIRAIRAMRCCGAKRSARGVASLSGYQGHGSVATPHNILITWAAMMRGRLSGEPRGPPLSNEALGYSEAAAQVLRQPEAASRSIFSMRASPASRASSRIFKRPRRPAR